MRKLTAVMNMTLDGFCDHTAGIPAEEIHDYYAELLRQAGFLIYGRTTYQLMEDYWPSVVKKPTGNKSFDEFALAIDNVSKIVYSRTLKSVSWRNTELRNEISKHEILDLKKQAGKPLYVGSPGLIVALTQMGLIDEYQICVQPIILGKGLTLFRDIQERIDLKLTKTKTFACGVVALCYERTSRRGRGDAEAKMPN